MPRALQHPARLVPLVFLAAIALGTALLSLPAARAGEGGAPLLVALFTATSAVCVTGLVMVDTASYWSPLGQGLILLLLQVGGFGIMSGATLLGLIVSRRVSLGARLLAQAEARGGLALGDVTAVLRLALVVTLGTEALLAVALWLRLALGHGMDWGEAAWHGLFHAVSAFNNAGFTTLPQGAATHAGDPLFLAPLVVGVVIGGAGLPVLHDLRREPRAPARWSVHTKLTLLGTAALLLLGALGVLLAEWGNERTLGALHPLARPFQALFHSAMTRSGGFSAVEVGAMRPETLMLSAALMLVGGGSAGTAGGIKVTTLLILLLAVRAEARGEPDATAFRRRIPQGAQRQALAVAVLAVVMVGLGTLLVLAVSDLPLDAVLFEVVSAFATVGLSTGVTPALPAPAQLLLVLFMFLGRVGTITVATGLALHERPVPYRYPEERPIVG